MADYFKEDILENAISNRQKERSERREDLRKKRELQEKRNAEAAATIEEALRRGIPRSALKKWLDLCK